MTKVSGKVSFNGAPPPKPGRLAFNVVPGTEREGLPDRPGSATFGEDGEFTVTSFKDGDGLLPGTYKVTIICVSGLPGQTTSFDQVSLVPADWTPEELVIKGDELPVKVEYDVPPK
jgi:hypothetical protein